MKQELIQKLKELAKIKREKTNGTTNQKKRRN